MLVDLPWVVTYFGVSLIDDPMSGLWVVVITEWVKKYPEFVL